jgi:biopolymer transport protein ExbD
MKLRAQHTTHAVIPTASMADIAFLLIVFFMVTFTSEVDRTQVTLPQTNLRFEIPAQSAYISVTEEGLIRVSNGEEMSASVPGVEDVLSFAAQVVAVDASKDFVIKADSNVPYRTIDKVIDALKQAKVKNIFLLSRPEMAEGG